MSPLLAVVLLTPGDLPGALRGLDLTPQQTKRVEGVLDKSAKQRRRLAETSKGDPKEKVKKANDAIDEKEQEAIARILTPEQLEKYERVRKLEKDGFHVGDGFYCSFRTKPYYLPGKSPQATPKTPAPPGGDAPGAAPPARQRDGVRLTITNRSGKVAGPARFVAQFSNGEGVVVHRGEFKVGRLKDGAGEQVTLLFTESFRSFKVWVVREGAAQ